MKIVLIGGHPKGFNEPFHIKTKSGKILRSITTELKIMPIFFDLWDNQPQMDSGKIDNHVVKKLTKLTKSGHVLVSLGRFTEKALRENEISCKYLPHPASRNAKYIKELRSGIRNLIG